MLVDYKTYQRRCLQFEKSKETNGFKGWRKAQYLAQDGHCAWCYKEVAYKDMDVDHITALNAGGDNSFENLVLACHNCNRFLKEGSSYNTYSYKRAEQE